MKVKFLKLKSWMLATLMGAMGFSSCHCHKAATSTVPDDKAEPEVRDRGDVRLMYGVPTMNFMIRGQVKDQKGRAVQGIRVNMLERGMEVKGTELQGDAASIKTWLDETSVATDRNGRFSITNSGIPQETVRLLVRDADGKANGEFRDKMVEMDVTPDNVDRTNAGGWNQGTFDKEIDIRLESK